MVVRAAGGAALRICVFLCLAFGPGLLGACDSATVRPEVEASTRAVTAGTADDGDDAVVALLMDGFAYCTGTAIAPRVVVTAAHCIHEVTPISVLFGSSVETGGVTIRAVGTRIHPSFDNASLAHDVGLLLLDAPAPATPPPLLTAPLQSSFIGSHVRVVGFGQTLDPHPTLPRKRQGTALIASYQADDFKLRPDPSLTCRGDSGGPAFLSLDGVEFLAGVSSSGDEGCESSATEMRIDAVAADFLEPYITATTEGAADVGQRCSYDRNCASSACFWPPDAPSFGYCSAACRASGDCPSHMLCDQSPAVKQCRYPPPSPGALGASCVLHADCEQGFCARSGIGQSRQCAQLCFPGDACSPGRQCAPNIDKTGTYACFINRSGGCSVVASSAAEFPGILAALVSLWLGRRPRSTPERARRLSAAFHIAQGG